MFITALFKTASRSPNIHHKKEIKKIWFVCEYTDAQKIIIQPLKKSKKKIFLKAGWGYSSVAQSLSGKCEVLSSHTHTHTYTQQIWLYVTIWINHE